MALLSLKLWELTDLAAPLMVILAVQTVMMGLMVCDLPPHGQKLRYCRAGLLIAALMRATPTAVKYARPLPTSTDRRTKRFDCAAGGCLLY